MSQTYLASKTIMIFKVNHQILLFILIIVFLMATSDIVAQLDSIKMLQKKITQVSNASNFSGRDTTYIDLLNNLSYRLRYTELDSMKLLTKNALELSKSINYRKGELEALANFSAYYLYKGNTGKVIQYGQKVLNAEDVNEFPRLQMKIYNQLGQAYFIKQDYPSTYTQFLNALELGEKYNDEDYKFRINMNLGTVFNLLEDYDEALEFYSAAEKSAHILDNATFKAMVQSNLGYLHIKKGDFEKAEELLLASITVFKTQKVTEWLSFAYSTYARLNINLGNFKLAEDNYQNALMIHNSLNDVKGRADIYYGLAKVNLLLEDFEKADKNINESLILYKSFNLKTGLENCYRVLYELKKHQGEISESLKYLELSDKLANDISKERNKRNLNMLNAKLNFEREKENLKAKNDEELEKQRSYVRWSLAAFVSLLIVALVILRSNRREKSLNKKLENQALILKENQQTLKNINNNQDNLFSIVGHDLRGPIISLKELLILYLEDPEGKDYFEKFAPQLRDDLEQVQFTMDNLLHWGKTQMKGSTTQIKKIAIKKELEIILQFFRKEMGKKSIRVMNQIIEEQYVSADPDHFKVIFRNLISNAIKFTPENGKITISTKIKYPNLIIKISDTGVGMTMEVVDKLFKNTEHFSTFGTNAEKGTGLGLRLAKEMAVKNNGDIYLNSRLNIGTDSFVELPLANSKA